MIPRLGDPRPRVTDLAFDLRNCIGQIGDVVSQRVDLLAAVALVIRLVSTMRARRCSTAVVSSACAASS